MGIDEIDKSFDGPKDQTKVILSHNFAYYLNDIVEIFPESKIVAVVRDENPSLMSTLSCKKSSSYIT